MPARLPIDIHPFPRDPRPLHAPRRVRDQDDQDQDQDQDQEQEQGADADLIFGFDMDDAAARRADDDAAAVAAAAARITTAGFRPARPAPPPPTAALRTSSLTLITPSATAPAFATQLPSYVPARARSASVNGTRMPSYTPLAPLAHQVHESHRYVTGRGFGSPGWNPDGTRRSSASAQSSQGRQNHQNGQNGQNSQGHQWPAGWLPSTPPAEQPQPAQPEKHWHHGEPAAGVDSLSPLDIVYYNNGAESGTMYYSYGAKADEPAPAPAPARAPAPVPEPTPQPNVLQRIAQSGRSVIVNGSTRDYDVELLNRLAYGDHWDRADADTAQTDAVTDAATETAPTEPVDTSEPSLVSGHGTVTDQGSVASGSARAALATAARATRALTTNPAAHHWLLKLPRAAWPRLARCVDAATLRALSTVHRVFVRARVARAGSHRTTPSQQQLLRARAAEREEQAAFAAGQADDGLLVLSPARPPTEAVQAVRPRHDVACFVCFRVRAQAHFPRTLVWPAPAVPTANTADAADAAAATGFGAVCRALTSRLAALMTAKGTPPTRAVRLPRFVPYIPVPPEVAAGLDRAVPVAVDDAVDEYGHFDRCCFECAVATRLMQPRERYVALDGPWRWVCSCGAVHAGEGDCRRCGDVV